MYDLICYVSSLAAAANLSWDTCRDWKCPHIISHLEISLSPSPSPLPSLPPSPSLPPPLNYPLTSSASALSSSINSSLSSLSSLGRAINTCSVIRTMYVAVCDMRHGNSDGADTEQHNHRTMRPQCMYMTLYIHCTRVAYTLAYYTEQWQWMAGDM